MAAIGSDIGAGSGIFSKRLLQGDAVSAICIDPAYQEERQELFNGKPIRFLRRIGSEKLRPLSTKNDGA
jgi:hypothetical protein